MFLSFFTITIRHLARHRFYALLNVAGLALGLSCLLIAALHFDYHLQWDNVHVNADRIYRIVRHVTDANGAHYTWGTHPVASHLKAEIPEIEESVRVLNRGMWIHTEDRGFRGNAATVDGGFTRIFTIPMVQGDASKGLQEHGSCFISESLSKKLFGEADPVGRTVSVAYKWIEGDYTITGVMQDAGDRNFRRLTYDLLTATAQFKDRPRQRAWEGWPKDQNSAPLSTYVLLRENVARSALQARLDDFSRTHIRPGAERVIHYYAQPLGEIHLYSQRDYGINDGADIARCQSILGIGALVLLLACLNYVNLVTAQSTTRAREVGIRKVSGACRSHLVGQFMGESILVTAVAFLISVSLAHAVLPYASDILNVNLTLGDASFRFLTLLPLSVILIVGVLAGCYPAFVLSAHPPVRAVSGRTSDAGGRSFLRTGLVVFQFSTAAILIVITLIVREQLDYMAAKDLGFETDNIVMMPVFVRFDDPNEARRKAPAIRNEMANGPGIANASAIFLPPHRVSSIDFRNIDVAGSTESVGLRYQGVDESYFETFGISFVSGRPPRPGRFDYISENELMREIAINEKAVRVLGLEGDPVGQRLPRDRVRDDGTPVRLWYHVAGVVADYHNQSLRGAIEPTLIETPGYYNYVAARLTGVELTSALEHLESVWDRFLPGKPFTYEFFDLQLERQYESELQLRRVATLFTVLSLVVSCLGILGLVTYTAHRRQKEIGIRKVLGADNSGILRLLTGEFIRLTAVSVVIAWPIAYVLGRGWLSDFAYRVELGATPFLASAALTLTVVLATVSTRAWRSAAADPVEALRNE